MKREKKLYRTKYNRKEIKKIMRELKKEHKFLTGYRFLFVKGGFIFRVSSLEFYRYDEFSHKQCLSSARFKVGIKEEGKGSTVTVEELSPVSIIGALIVLAAVMAVTTLVAVSNNMELLPVLTKAFLITAGALSLILFILFCSSRYEERNKESRDKGEIFLKNRLELEPLEN